MIEPQHKAKGAKGHIPVMSVIIPTCNSERPLVQTLAALVPGAMAGIVREVIVADAGSQDGTARVADLAGCHFLMTRASLGENLKAAAALAHARWLCFLRPGAVPAAPWIDEANRFIREAELGDRREALAAVFRRTTTFHRPRPPMIEVLSLIAGAFRATPHPDQGLLISKQRYDLLGGHRAKSDNPELDLLRRVGRRSLVTLQCGLSMVG